MKILKSKKMEISPVSDFTAFLFFTIFTLFNVRTFRIFLDSEILFWSNTNFYFIWSSIEEACEKNAQKLFGFKKLPDFPNFLGPKK